MNLTFIPNRSVTLLTSDAFRVLTATIDNPNWDQIEEAIRNDDEQALIRAISISESVRTFGNSNEIAVKGNDVYYKGVKLFGLDVNRIIAYLNNRFPCESMIAFLESKLRNEKVESVNSLYAFLEKKGMPVTANGSVLGYKGVTADCNSIMTGNEPLIRGIRNANGSINNAVGQVVHMERQYVNADPANGCAPGLHIGSRDYAKGFGARTMVAEFFPEHVVMVPTVEIDKLRVFKYRIVGEVTDEITLNDNFDDNYVRPENEPAPFSQFVSPAVMEIAQKNVDIQSDQSWLDGRKAGVKDGRGHQKRLFYECDRNTDFTNYSKEYVLGYLVGYRIGRDA